jgi:GYD domain-containing protein
VIVELPDNVAAAALGLAAASTGLASVETTVLLTPAEIDAVAKRQVAYTPPGK